tara:strand:- start:79 stop:900 length:822 start_codon:yes stop_codon:yes gene_type:complete
MKNKRFFLRKYLKKTFNLIFLKIFKKINSLLFERYLNVYRNDQKVFEIKNMGSITRARALTFETKEPETIEWIESFSENDKLLDIGANIGIYSLYAAHLGKSVISIEPDVLNFALLNLNIKKNLLSQKITAYGIAIHDKEKFSTLNSSSFEWGSALSSFDNHHDFQGNEFIPVHSQGVYGLPLDKFISKINLKPNHIKIDVDGNEFLILKSAINTLLSRELKSILVELDEEHPNYSKSLNIIESSGLKLFSKTHAAIFDNSQFCSSYNHIFYK